MMSLIAYPTNLQRSVSFNRYSMRTLRLAPFLGLALCSMELSAQQPATDGPYKVLKTARVGGEGGTDYIYADVVGRKLYIPRGAVRADTVRGTPAVPARITVFNLDDLSPAGEMLTAPNSQGNGAVVDPKSGHGFASSRPALTMFDTKTLQLLKSIPIDSGFGPDGIFMDEFSGRVYVGSHPTKDAMVINASDGSVAGRIDLGGVPEQNVSDGKGTLYFILQDQPGSIAVVDTKTMKTTKHYSIGDHGRCNGLAMDVKNKILFAACAAGGSAPVAGQPPQTPNPAMIMVSATDGKILAEIPLPAGNDGAAFNPATMEAFTTMGNGMMTVVKEKSPTSFEIEQNVSTMNGARTIAFDSKTGHIFVMSVERGPAPVNPPPGGRGGGAGPVIPGSFSILMIGKP